MRKYRPYLLAALAILVGSTAVFLLGASDPSSAGAVGIGLPSFDPFRLAGEAFGKAAGAAVGMGAKAFQEALEWLLGGIQATITLALIKWLIHIELPIGGSLYRATGPMVAIGGFFLIIGLITSVGDGYREVAAGTDTGPRVIGQVIFRTIGLAILLAAWYWIVPLAVDVANGMSSYILSDDDVRNALKRSFITSGQTQGLNPLMWLISALAIVFTVFTLIVLKFVMTIAFACIYVGGPAAIGFAALPRVGSMPLAIVTRGLFTLSIIPLLWCVVFVAWAGVSAGFADILAGDKSPPGGGVSIMGGLMGSCLFMAGLIVILAVTKKALAMTTFGLQLNVPGANAARQIANIGMHHGMRNAMTTFAMSKAGGGAPGGGGGGNGNGGGGNGAAPAGGGMRARATQAYGKLLNSKAVQVASGTDALNRQRAYQDQRQEASEFRAHEKQMDREEDRLRQASEWDNVQQTRAQGRDQVNQERQRARGKHDQWMREADSAAIANTTHGKYNHRVPNSKDTNAQKDAGELRSHAESSPTTKTQLGLQRTGLPHADRAAVANLAKSSLEANPGNSEAAKAHFQERMVGEYAGMPRTERQNAAVLAAVAADPKDVKDVFSKDRDNFTDKGVTRFVHDKGLFEGNFKDPGPDHHETQLKRFEHRNERQEA